MRLFKEPLLYFALLGVVVFCVDAWLRREADSIEVDATVRSELDAELKRTLERPPSNVELERALEEWTTTELLFREASRLGLQENDALIRTHLATKLKNLVKQRTIVEPATEQELRAHFEAHPEHYGRPDTFDVTIVFIAHGSSPDEHTARVNDLQLKLSAGLEPRGAGDHFPRGPALRDMLLLQLEQVLKADLDSALVPDTLGQWQRVPTARGSYLLRLDRLNSGKPNFDASRAAIAAELEARKRDAAFELFLGELRTQYAVVHAP